LVQLHAHSHFSDGLVSPGRLAALVREAGLEGFGLADHDTVAGLEEAGAAAGELGLVFVPSVELSCLYRGYPLHLLGYFLDPLDSALEREMAAIRESRVRRGELMVARLQELGYPISFQRVQQLASGGNITRPHIAMALVEAGVVARPEDAFTEELIGTGGRAYVEKYAPPPERGLALLLGAGAAPVLAHPGIWRPGEGLPAEVLEELASEGLVGVEAYHPDHSREDAERYAEVARSLGLQVLAGADWHGWGHGGELGEFTVDRGTVEELFSRRGG
jgi:predicted metal-dependent phosphoesterase TrpH